MKYIIAFFLVLTCFSTISQAQVPIIGVPTGNSGAGYTASEKGVYLRWRAEQGFKYTILRRTDDSPYEVISEDAKLTMGSFLDSTAEMNTKYYYLISYEIKLLAATRLLDSFDFSQPMTQNNTTHRVQDGSIIITPGKPNALISRSTGIKLDPSKYYEIRIDFGEIRGNGGYISAQLSGRHCNGSLATYGADLVKYSNKSFYCRIPKLIGPKPAGVYYNDAINLWVSTWQNQNYSVEIKKIEFFEGED